MVICATGLRPASALATDAGIATHQGGIVVNEHMQTNDPHIYAGGDVIMVKDQVTGTLHASCTWPDAMMQGLFAANAIAGKPRSYPGVMTISTSAFFGVKFATYGMKNLPQGSTSVIKQGSDFYHQFIIQNDLLIGFVLIGQTQRLSEIKRALLTRQPVSSFLL
jgi:NAD(P)H-nitrite reductase large subunit